MCKRNLYYQFARIECLVKKFYFWAFSESSLLLALKTSEVLNLFHHSTHSMLLKQLQWFTMNGNEKANKKTRKLFCVISAFLIECCSVLPHCFIFRFELQLARHKRAAHIIDKFRRSSAGSWLKLNFLWYELSMVMLSNVDLLWCPDYTTVLAMAMQKLLYYFNFRSQSSDYQLEIKETKIFFNKTQKIILKYPGTIHESRTVEFTEYFSV